MEIKRTAMRLPDPPSDPPAPPEEPAAHIVAVDPLAVIHVMVATNPKKPNSRAYKKFAELRTGMTVQEYYALEGHRPDLDSERRWPRAELLWCLRKQFVTLHVATPPPPPAAESNEDDELA